MAGLTRDRMRCSSFLGKAERQLADEGAALDLPGRRNPGPAGDVQRSPSPVGGGSAGHLEMAETLIFTRLLEIISTRSVGNAESPGRRPFTDLQGHFHEYGRGADG
jgi:hypothetical protein